MEDFIHKLYIPWYLVICIIINITFLIISLDTEGMQYFVSMVGVVVVPILLSTMLKEQLEGDISNVEQEIIRELKKIKKTGGEDYKKIIRRHYNLTEDDFLETTTKSSYTHREEHYYLKIWERPDISKKRWTLISKGCMWLNISIQLIDFISIYSFGDTIVGQLLHLLAGFGSLDK